MIPRAQDTTTGLYFRTCKTYQGYLDFINGVKPVGSANEYILYKNRYDAAMASNPNQTTYNMNRWYFFVQDVGRLYNNDVLVASTIHFVTTVPAFADAFADTMYAVLENEKITLYVKGATTMVSLTQPDVPVAVTSITQGTSSTGTLLEITKSDGSTSTITIADLFLKSAVYDKGTHTLTFTMQDNSTLPPINLSELVDAGPIWQSLPTGTAIDGQDVAFYYCTKAEYDIIAKDSTHDKAALFFVYDDQDIYLNDKVVTKSVVFHGADIAANQAIPGKIYINPNTQMVQTLDNSGNWYQLIPTIYNGTDLATAEPTALVTVGAVVNGINTLLTSMVSTALANKYDKVVGAVPENIVVFGTGGTLGDSNFKTGASAISGDPGERTWNLATEAAVAAYVGDTKIEIDQTISDAVMDLESKMGEPTTWQIIS